MFSIYDKENITDFIYVIGAVMCGSDGKKAKNGLNSSFTGKNTP